MDSKKKKLKTEKHEMYYDANIKLTKDRGKVNFISLMNVSSS